MLFLAVRSASSLVSYALLSSNSTTMKNSLYLTPSQETRKKIYFAEGIIQAVGILLLMGIPYIHRNGADVTNRQAPSL